MTNNLSKIIDLLSTIVEKLDYIANATNEPKKPACRYMLLEWLEEWFTVYKAPTLKDSGYDLRNTINRHVLPHIENKPLNEYTALDITKALNAVKSERMRQITRQVYNQSFREAVKLGYIEKNPVEHVRAIAHTYKNGRTLERAEEAEFLRVARSDAELYPLFAFYLMTGARPSEPLRLRWEDITEEYIRIRGTKTVKSDRRLPLSDNLRDLLTTVPHKGDYVFPYTYAKIRFAMERLRKRLSFNMTLKDLRHTFGTRCVESGVSMKTVQKWLGHSKYETTANIYSHITTEFEREEVQKIDSQNKQFFTSQKSRVQ